MRESCVEAAPNLKLSRPSGAIEDKMIKKLLHTRYRVEDLEKTVSFYRDVLGLEEVRRHTSGRGSQLGFPESAREAKRKSRSANSTKAVRSWSGRT